MKVQIDICGVFDILLKVILILLCAHIIGLIARLVFDHDYIFGLVPLFDLNTEGNIPTAYSGLQLLVASAILAAIGVGKRINGDRYFLWLILAFIFAFLSYDEIFQIHELLNRALRDRLAVGGVLYFPWVVPYGIATAVIAILFGRFLLWLPQQTARRFGLAGIIYIAGVLGFEMLGALSCSGGNCHAVYYALTTTVEELCELLGIALFIRALLQYIAGGESYLVIEITAGSSSSDREKQCSEGSDNQGEHPL